MSTYLSKELFSLIKPLFPNIKMGNDEGVVTTDSEEAVFFDFDFEVNNQKVATVSISLVDSKVLKLFFTKDILNHNSLAVKKKWFDFIKKLRNFSKRRLIGFEPHDIAKQNLSRRDYKEMSAKAQKEKKMNESSLYGSTKSSYQKLENARMIIRHSKKVQEEAPLSRTRNIDSIYVENEAGERFKYPYNHLSGARAMMRHLSNGGNPYDNFGQYIVGLSENVYNLRKFNHLVNRNAFLENTNIGPIAEAAKKKTETVKKTLEKIQKQSGYDSIKESFVEYKKNDLDEKTIESLKEKFTLQQFNEELIDLFPFISDLISEHDVTNFDELVSELSEKDNQTIEGTPVEKYDIVKEFESAINQIIDEENSILSTNDDTQSDAISRLSELMSKHFPVGTNGLNAIESLQGIIDSTELNQQFKEVSIKDSDTCIRHLILDWLNTNAPDVVDQIDLGDFKPQTQDEAIEENKKLYQVVVVTKDGETMRSKHMTKKEADTFLWKAAKKNKYKTAKIVPVKQKEESLDQGIEENKTEGEVEEYVKSLYDYTTNNFPRGETGVLIAVEKKFGDSSIETAKQVIQTLKAGVDEDIAKIRKYAGIQ
jgi:hypothetical protein